MKQDPKGIMGVRIIFACVGIFWTIITFGIMGGNPMVPGVVRILFPGFGILFAILSLIGVIGNKNQSGDEENTAGKSEITPQQQERPAAPREKKTVFCPYCGTALEEDYKICGSCGAPRKSK
jgi:hypothetical protein